MTVPKIVMENIADRLIVPLVVMEGITHLYDCTLDCNGVCIIIMTVHYIVIESIPHLCDCTLECNGEYRSPL